MPASPWLTWQGRIDSKNAPGLKEDLSALVAGGVSKIILNFSSLEMTSSAGLRVILTLAQSLEKKGGVLRLFGLNEAIKEVFYFSGFDDMLDIFADEAAALDGI